MRPLRASQIINAEVDRRVTRHNNELRDIALKRGKIVPRTAIIPKKSKAVGPLLLFSRNTARGMESLTQGLNTLTKLHKEMDDIAKEVKKGRGSYVVQSKAGGIFGSNHAKSRLAQLSRDVMKVEGKLDKTLRSTNGKLTGTSLHRELRGAFNSLQRKHNDIRTELESSGRHS